MCKKCINKILMNANFGKEKCISKLLKKIATFHPYPLALTSYIVSSGQFTKFFMVPVTI